MMRFSKMGTFTVVSLAIFLSGTPGIQVAAAVDFLEKRECTIGRPSRPPVHTRCVISGGMSNGRIDVGIKNPDGKTFALEGPIDGADGTDGYKYLLEGRPARKSDDVGDSQCDGSMLGSNCVSASLQSENRPPFVNLALRCLATKSAPNDGCLQIVVGGLDGRAAERAGPSNPFSIVWLLLSFRFPTKSPAGEAG